MATGTDARKTLLGTIAALEAQRSLLGDEVLDAALAPLRARLDGMEGPQPHPPHPSQLRQVSVLFLDIVGSTQLSQHLDPEELQDVMDGALAAFTAVVRRHGGEVLQYAGDNLLAVFGAGGAREDDAERAVQAGLALLAEARVWAGTVQQRHGRGGFDARVGIHTGAVLRGGGVDDDNTLRGLAVNVAARMEQTAPPGRLRISHDTWALVRGMFSAEAQPPIEVKGHDAPIRSWLVQRALPRAFMLPTRGIEGLETPLVGRDAERALLEGALDDMVASGQARALTVVADAGLGKSRLLHEFQRHLAAHDSSFWLLLARAQPSSGLQPYGLLRDLLFRRLEVFDSDSAEQARQRIVQGLAPWLDQPGDPAPELLGQLIGLDFSASPAVALLGSDARLLRERALAALGLVLERLSSRGGSPVVMLLDDLQWADDASLDALPALLTRTAARPLLVLMSARRGLLERRADWGRALPAHRLVELQPLPDAEGRALTRALLHRLGEVPQALAQLIERRAEGNPFYAEELVKMLLDRGVIRSELRSELRSEPRSDILGDVRHSVRTEAGRWSFHPELLDEQRLPASLTGVLQARIDALAPAERRALQMSSVIGPVFWDEALRALDAQGPQSLPELERKSMVQPRRHSAFEGTVEEGFHHHLLHQVSYETVLRSERRQAHARAAAWLTGRMGERSDEYLAITAEHHERAGQAQQAAEWYLRAFDMAMARHALPLALHYLDRCEAQGAASSAHDEHRLLLRRIGIADALALRDMQGQAIERLLALAQAEGQPLWRSRALASKTLLADRLGRIDEAAALAEEGLLVAESADDAVRAALCRGNLAWVSLERGQLAEARTQLAAGLRWATLAHERPAVVDDRLYLPQMLLIQAQLCAREHDDVARAAALARAWELAAPLNAPRLHASCHDFMAMFALDRADLATARERLLAMEQLAVQVGIPALVAAAAEKWARWHLLAGDWVEAERRAAAAIEIYIQTGAERLRAQCLSTLGEALVRTGRHAQALVHWQDLATLWQHKGGVVDARAARLRWAAAAMQVGDAGQAQAALACVRAELPHIDTVDALESAQWPLMARLAAWQVLHAAGDAAAARQLELAGQELEVILGPISDPEVRERVRREVPWHRDVDAALQAAAGG
jgi:class 3 adenylate cyclase